MRARKLFFAVLLLGSSGCKEKPSDVRVFVASSAVPAFDEMAERIGRDVGKLQLQGQSSSSLAQQILRGARCDVVLLADNEWMDELEANHKIIKSSRVDLLGNSLVWVTTPGQNFQELMRSGARIALADPDHVPLGKYAKEALKNQNIFESLSDRLVFAQDARATLFLVESGKIPLGIVFKSDALSSNRVSIAQEIDEALHRPVRYSIAVCEGASEKAPRLQAMLRSEAAQKVFAKKGFRVLADKPL